MSDPFVLADVEAVVGSSQTVLKSVPLAMGMTTATLYLWEPRPQRPF